MKKIKSIKFLSLVIGMVVALESLNATSLFPTKATEEKEQTIPRSNSYIDIQKLKLDNPFENEEEDIKYEENKYHEEKEEEEDITEYMAENQKAKNEIKKRKKTVKINPEWDEYYEEEDITEYIIKKPDNKNDIKIK